MLNVKAELLDQFIKVYKGIDLDKIEIEHDLKQFVKANTGIELDFRTVEGRAVLRYIFNNLSDFIN